MPRKPVARVREHAPVQPSLGSPPSDGPRRKPARTSSVMREGFAARHKGEAWSRSSDSVTTPAVSFVSETVRAELREITPHNYVGR